MSIQWRKSYEIGVEEVDSQHKELFKRIRDLLDACSQNKGRQEVSKMIDFLEEYVEIHFTSEEKLHIKNLYPEYKGHKLLHAKFVKNFEELKKKFEDEGPTLQFVGMVNKFVVEWLIHHIGTADKAFGNYMKSREIQLSRQ
ncbi:MAG: hemerythrin family protein [Clostridium sp.]|jgi:hemerythrin|nr:hemerythrin family protein [Clostridium sp.]